MIENVKIKNFGSLVDNEFLFSDLNILTGLNNTGKSTLMQAIKMFDEDFRIETNKFSGETDIVLQVKDNQENTSVYTINEENIEKFSFDMFFHLYLNGIMKYNPYPALGFLGVDVKPPVVDQKKSLKSAVVDWMSTIDNDYEYMQINECVNYLVPVIRVLLCCSVDTTNVYVDKPEIVYIDKPESNLHAFAQTKIGDLIARSASSGSQVFVETHSEHVFDGIRIAVKNKIIDAEKIRIFFFTKDNGVTSVETIVLYNNGQIEYWPKGFFDQYIENGRELLI